jgi:orotate phosphoribosyltransferase
VSTVDDLGLRLLDVALLEGDFTLRSGKRSRWYLDKYRFETEPTLLRPLGAARGTGARGGRVGRLGIDGVRAALHHHPR